MRGTRTDGRGRRARGAVTLLAIAGLLPWSGVAAQTEAEGKHKVIVIGIDGLDPKLLQQFADEGALPNFKRLIDAGDFKPLGTTMPPLSPVAWSTFITGMDPGGHGIFDFIHREPETYLPTPATSQAPPLEYAFTLPRPGEGSCEYPAPWASAEIENMRKGQAFWELLDAKGVPTTLFRIPADFPPTEAGHVLSGMGTPDLIGTHGTFSFYTDRRVENAGDISGGDVYPVRVVDNKVSAELVGPDEPFHRVEKRTVRRSRNRKKQYEHPKMKEPFTVYVDPAQPVAKLMVQDTEVVLQQGEWSDWVEVDFAVECAPMTSVSAIARFYMKQVRPDFELYVTPLQISPSAPVQPISFPDDWVEELHEALGYFYTQELPEDTKAFSGGILSGREFREQSEIVHRERMKAFQFMLDGHEEGLLFFYFSSVDQRSHMLWRYMDKQHPYFETEEILMNGIREIYGELDVAIGKALERIDGDDTLIVMSDHGFNPFYWGVNLNSWLLEKGYVVLQPGVRQEQVEYLLGVDWSKTTAYALGLNGLYVNLRGRERQGIVNPGGEYQDVLDRLERDMLEMKDPRNGQSVVTLAVQTHRDFNGEMVEIGPDIIVGYNEGYRSSWENPLGEFPKEIFTDNPDPWSGDHSVDYRFVPGVLLSNKQITMDAPALYDLTVAILDEYGVGKTGVMLGEDCLGDGPPTKTARAVDQDETGDTTVVAAEE